MSYMMYKLKWQEMTFPRRYKLSLRALAAIVITALLLASPNAFAQPQTWKINLSNADIKKFIEEVASITGKTFVVDPRVKGNVTVISTTSLDKEGVYELFLSVLRVHGFGASPTGNVIRIVQSTIVKQSGGAIGLLTDLPPEEIVTRVIPAQNVAEARKCILPRHRLASRRVLRPRHGTEEQQPHQGRSDGCTLVHALHHAGPSSPAPEQPTLVGRKPSLGGRP